MRLEFVAVRVVKEFQPVLRENFAGLVEHRRGVAAGFFVEGIRVRNPGAAGVLQSERLGFGRDAFGVIAKPLEWKVPADRFESALAQLGREFLRREIVSAGQLHEFDAEAFDFVERVRHVFLELLAQAVKLQPDRSFETRADAGRRRLGARSEEHQRRRSGAQAQNLEVCFHDQFSH